MAKMFRDYNGKTGFRMLVGKSGKVYGNARLLKFRELEDMLADGITMWEK